MDVGIQSSWNGNPALVNAALVDPLRGGQTTSNESLGAAGNMRPRTVDFGTPYKRPMSSSGLQSVEVMLMKFSTAYFLIIGKMRLTFVKLLEMRAGDLGWTRSH
ncbi:jg23933 [Pararge aegeria aegeria]|uniref:Jg23933 protein n=1 Tax=Pararge aegeria aegeria TaxID=348720 RepID=A0A8S4RQL2_9NEOP|nr:jg23933 [Pararge aegeria aegeria]